MDKKQFLELLDKHDWYYNFSDDNRVYDMGYSQSMTILRIIKERPDLEDLYDQYIEYVFNRGTKPTEVA